MQMIGVVVLNYKNYRETIKCVSSILKQKNCKFHIVVVDNGSMNESGEALKKQYNSDSRVTLICNLKNEGYAKGNNVGINYLRKKGFSYIVICNSDIEFSTEYILEQMISQYEIGVGVMIPIINNLDGTIEMRAQYRKTLFQIRVAKELFKMITQKNAQPNSNSLDSSAMAFLEPGVQKKYRVITGSIFLLGPSFFEHYSGLFPETFLYVEELATMLLVHKAHLDCAIADTDSIIHMGAGSTDSTLRTGTIKKKRYVSDSAKKVFGLLVTPYFFINRKYGI